MFFDFEGAENTGYLVEGSRKIMFWSSYDDSITYAADNITYLGAEYKAIFEAKNDGLYVQYVAVPESATMAMLLGAFAFGLVLVRRRR